MNSLATLPYLITLNADINHITDDGMIAISKNSHVKMLDLSHNEITDKGAFAFAQNKMDLNIFVVNYNHLTTAGINELRKTTKTLFAKGANNLT
jgi:hypothetical protein